MHRNPSVDVHQFAMTPRADIPRSSFRMQKSLKTTFNGGNLIPIFCEEVIPGDSISLKATLFARMATPIVPVMDNIHLESFFFFVPNRLVWTNWVKFMGEQAAPGDSISYTIPQIVSNVGGYSPLEIEDYFGLPTQGQVGAGNTVSHSALPLRAYNLIFNEWFRDENLVTPAARNVGDGPDLETDYALRRRGKRKDYFTGALPWTQKGTSVSIPLGTTAPVKPYSTEHTTGALAQGMWMRGVTAGAQAAANTPLIFGGSGQVGKAAATSGTFNEAQYPSNLYADLSTATAATINQLRQAFQTQRLLERDARGGTRYVELVQSHFGVRPPDFRLQRPEYLGGGYSPVNINPVAQQSATGLTGATTPIATLSAFGTSLGHGHGFSQSFTEHGYIIGLVNVRADLNYQQGLRRHWSRSTRYDYYFPAFAMLGEQAINNKEIYVRGDSNDNLVFGYQERWAEYRYMPSEITGYFRSTTTGTLHIWHLAQQFTSLPTLNATFIEENPPLQRVMAVGASANGQEFLMDAFFDIKAVRPMPMYSVPGQIDHF